LWKRLTAALATGPRSGARGSARRIDNALVVVQLSLSVILLVGAGLMLKSFQRLTEIDLGFRPENVTAISLPLPRSIGMSAIAMKTFNEVTLARMRAIPGVKDASLTSSLPMGNNADFDGFLINGRPVPPSGAEDQAYQVGVSPEYFQTVGIPLKYGRDFVASDDSLGANVAIVDEELANRYWKGADAIGKQIKSTGNPPWFTIIGVVGTVRDGDPTQPPRPHVYYSIPQVGGNPLALTIRTGGAAAPVVAAARKAMTEIEPSIPLDDVQTLSGIVDQTYATRRLAKILLGGFAMIGLLLAVVGIYGVMSLQVANRTREFGIHLAIGAEPGALVRLVLRNGAVLAGIGVVVGVAGAVAVTRWLGSLLYDVSPTDPLVLIALPLGLAVVAIATCYLPARRAARSDPLRVLRSE
jgi:putative ABC transport system permease protein